VRAEMARRRLSQTVVAEHLGVSQMFISRRLSGDVPFDIVELYQLADFFGVPVTVLLGEAA